MTYDSHFFREQEATSLRSAAAVVPLLLKHISVESVVDVGCGIGAWTSQFIAAGIEDVIGLDGDYVDKSMLKIPAEQFLPYDLNEPIRLGRRFSLAVCLEVAEHLPAARAAGLISDLVSLAPCILFSAAIPGQSGTHHVNEQHLSYWIRHFSEHGYAALDLIRPAISDDDSIEWWFRQNIVVFAGPGHPLHAAGFPKPMDMVHPILYERVRQQVANQSVRSIGRSLAVAVMGSIRRRLGGARQPENGRNGN